MIEIKNISKRYGEQMVISEVQLPITEQKLTAFIGPNGAGKGTLLSKMNRLTGKNTGDIYLDHNEVRTWKHSELSKKLELLNQAKTLQLKITVREFVNFGRFPYSKTCLTEEDQEKVDVAMKSLALSELAEEPLINLSGGQLQRAAVAMVLAQDSDYLLLDEPLSNLDMHFAVQMMQTFRYLVDELGKTIVVVLHDLNIAASYADEIVAIKKGRLFAHGSTKEIIQTEILNNLYDTQIKICEIDGKRFCLYGK